MTESSGTESNGKGSDPAKSAGSDPEPSQDPETEEDTASGGAPAPPDTNTRESNGE
jgi:hypothetical protein